MKNKKLVVIVSLLLVACVCLALTACNKNPTTTPTQLAAPVISVDNATGVVSWKKVEHADSYDVKVNTNAAINVTTTSYTFPAETAAGSYDVTVIAKSSDTDKYSASPASNKVTYVKEGGGSDERVLSQLTLLQEPDKSVYFLDEGAEEFDLTGAKFIATYSEGSPKTIDNLSEISIGSYTMPVGSGDVDVPVSYTENGVTKETTVTFTVRVRTEADIEINGVDIIPNSYDLSEYVIANKEVTNVTKMDGTPIDATFDATNEQAPKTTVAKSDLKEGRNLLAVTNSDDERELVLVVVGKLIKDYDDLEAMRTDVEEGTSNNYYVLVNDLGLENRECPSIGRAPIAMTPGDTAPNNVRTPDISGSIPAMGSMWTESGETAPIENQQGVKFEGTFDGLGHTIMDYNILNERPAPWKPAGYGVALFGWIATDAKVCNLNLRNVTSYGGEFAALIAGVNQGTIENISIEETCEVNVAYGNAAAFVGYNFGTIKNVVSLMSGSTPIECAYTPAGVADDSVEKGFMDTADHTAALKGGWRYFDGIGTLYVTPSYVRINTTENELAISQDELELSVIMQENDSANVEVHFFGQNASQLTYVWRDGKLYVKLANVATTTLQGGEEINMSVSGRGTTATFVVKITEARVIGHEFCDSENHTIENFSMQVTEGMDINLDEIYVLEKYSNNTTVTIHPIVRVEGFDKDGTVGVAQTVKAFYGTGDNDYLTFTVTLIAKQIDRIEIAKSPKTNYTTGDSALDLTGAEITVYYNNGTHEDIALTIGMISGNYDLDTAGTYNLVITHGSQTCPLTITVVTPEDTVESVILGKAPAKTTYKYGDTVVAADLKAADGEDATIIVKMSVSGNQTVPIAIDKISYNFYTVGSANITVAYDEDHSVNIPVTVVDYATGLNVTPSATVLAYSKSASLDLVANATYTITMASEADPQPVTSGVTASDYKPGLNTITYTYTDEYATVTAEQEYEIWYEITDNTITKVEDVITHNGPLEEWTFMQQNLDGYFRLVGDLDFGETTVLPIGKQPINEANNESSCNCDPATANVQVGVPFTGKFDGQGFTIMYIKLDGWADFTGETFGLSLFGYIGKDGEVKNFTVKNSSFTSYNQTGFIATINEGLVENIVIDSTCTIKANWGTAGIVVFNYGTGILRNAVSYVTTVAKGQGSVAMNKTSANYGTIEKCYVANEEDFLTNSAALAEVDGWAFIEDYGPVYGKYVVAIPETTAPQGGKATFTIYHADTFLIDYINIWGPKDPAAYPTRISDSDGVYVGTFDLKTDMTVGQTYTVGLRVNGKYIMYRLTIIAPVSEEGL